ncbi:hypothetical protein ACKLNO_09425 [Neisseriaceae bacterium B1]
MLGLAVIFALILWVSLIILSVWLPLKIFKNNGTLATILAITGFMLTCGFWVIKWNMESIAAQKEAEKMCQQAGVTIYMQPEKWKEMVGGEEAWKELGYKRKYNLFEYEEKREIPNKISFEGKIYENDGKMNDRVAAYEYIELGSHGFFASNIYYDVKTQTVLFKKNIFKASDIGLGSGLKLLFYRGGKSCLHTAQNPYKQFFSVHVTPIIKFKKLL